MDALDIDNLPRMIRLTYRVFAMRAMVYLALIITAALFSVALALQTWVALAVAGTFAVLVFLPILSRCARKEDPDGPDS